MNKLLIFLLSMLAVSLEAATITNWGSQLPTAAPVGSDVILMQKGGVTYYFTPNQLAANIATNAQSGVTNKIGNLNGLATNTTFYTAINIGTSNGVDAGSYLLPVRTNWSTVVMVGQTPATTSQGANSVGGNLWIGGGGPSSVGAVGLTHFGSGNTSAGRDALVANTTGYRNVAVGNSSQFQTTTGAQNIAVGFASLYANLNGNENISIGTYSMFNSTTGFANTAVGDNSLNALLNGYANVAVGNATLQALNDTATNFGNTAVGYQALKSLTNGLENTAIGSQALVGTLTGSRNTGVGEKVLDGNKGNRNIGVGHRAGYIHWNGDDNIFIGTFAADSNAGGNWDGGQNTIVGGYSLFNVDSGASNNVTLGFKTGHALTTGAGNIIIGHNVDVPTPTTSSALSIGNLIYGSGLGATGITASTGLVGIGTNTMAATLHIRPGQAGQNYLRIDDTNGTPRWRFGAYGGSSIYGAAWNGVGAQTDANFTLASDGDATILNGATTLSLWVAGVARVRIDNTGKFGIGTLAPSSTLDATGQVRSASAIITNSVSLLAKAFAAPASTAFTTAFGAHLWSDGTNLCVVLEDSAGTRTTNKLSMTAWP